MRWNVVVILVSNVCLVWAENKVNGTDPEEKGPPQNASCVCKADYNSKFNIDSKELGTTCVSRSRVVSKLIISNKLRDAMEKMKKDFQQLQQLIDQETQSQSDGEKALRYKTNLWKNDALAVQRDYEKENANMDEVVGYSANQSPSHLVSLDTDAGLNPPDTYFGMVQSKPANTLQDSYSPADGYDYVSRGAYQPGALPPLSSEPEASYASSGGYQQRSSPHLSSEPEASYALNGGYQQRASPHLSSEPEATYGSSGAYKQGASPHLSSEPEASYGSTFLNQPPGKSDAKLTRDSEEASSNTSY